MTDEKRQAPLNKLHDELEALYCPSYSVSVSKLKDFRRERSLYELRDGLKHLEEGFCEVFCEKVNCSGCAFKDPRVFSLAEMPEGCIMQDLKTLQRRVAYVAAYYGYRRSRSFKEELGKVYERIRELETGSWRKEASITSSGRWWERFWKNGREERDERH